MSVLDWVNPVKWFGKTVETVGNTVVDVTKVFKGSESDRENNTHQQYLASMQAFSNEFAPKQNRTKWDSFWDGINRMPRPLIVIAIFSYFGLSYYSPTEFQALNVALDTVPEQMWWIMTAVVSFYFAAREFQKGRDTKMALSDKEFKSVQERIAKLREKTEKELPAKSMDYINPSVEAWKKTQAAKSE